MFKREPKPEQLSEAAFNERLAQEKRFLNLAYVAHPNAHLKYDINGESLDKLLFQDNGFRDDDLKRRVEEPVKGKTYDLYPDYKSFSIAQQRPNGTDKPPQALARIGKDGANDETVADLIGKATQRTIAEINKDKQCQNGQVLKYCIESIEAVVAQYKNMASTEESQDNVCHAYDASKPALDTAVDRWLDRGEVMEDHLAQQLADLDVQRGKLLERQKELTERLNQFCGNPAQTQGTQTAAPEIVNGIQQQRG